METEGKVLASIIAAFFVLTLLAAVVSAVPPTINYQGYIEDSGGTPVNGTLSMTFSIYNAPTNGSTLWTETQAGVQVTDGAFSVALGSVSLINLPFDEQYYLGVQVGADAEMTPRAVLLSVPYAMRASAANTAGYADTAGAANTAAILGNKTLSELVALLDNRYGNLGDSLLADFSAAPLIITVNNTVDFTDFSNGVPTSWSWDFGDSSTSTLQHPSHTYTSEGTYTVSLTVGDGVTSNTAVKVDYITVYPFPQGTITTVDSAGEVGYYTSIDIGADGLPVVSYLEWGSASLKILHCGDASCLAGNTASEIASGVGSLYTSLTIGADNFPVVSYFTMIGGDLYVAHCGNGTCTSNNTITTVASTGVVGEYSSIAIGADNLPVISYYNATSADLMVVHCGNASCSSGNTTTTVASTGDVGSHSSIAIGTDNLPVISYYNATSADLMVAHCGTASCSSGNTTTTVASTGVVGEYSSIAIGTDNLPVISYYNATSADLMVAHCGDAPCSTDNTINTVDSTGDVGQFTSIAIGTDDLPVISYRDVTNGDLKLAHCGNASCTSGNTITTVDSTGDVGLDTSIAIGTDGLPVISYYDITNGDLKVAKCGDETCLVWP